jgi:hypothetical protein
LDFGFWILENPAIPHFKIDRPLERVKTSEILLPEELINRKRHFLSSILSY